MAWHIAHLSWIPWATTKHIHPPHPCRNVDGNAGLTGTLPTSWGTAGRAGFPALKHLSFSRCSLQGELPASWGSPDVFPSLQLLFLDSNNLTGECRASGSGWATGQEQQQGHRAVAQAAVKGERTIGLARFAGTIPASWGSNTAFPALQIL